MINSVIDAEGNVVNIVEVDGSSNWTPPEDCTVVAEEFQIGGTYIDGVYTPPAQPEPITIPPPTSCTKLGLKRTLDELGQWQAIKAAIASNPDVQEEWDLAIELRRNDPIVQHMITVTGMTDEQVDALLIRANEIVA